MEIVQLHIEENGWFVLLCLTVAALYSYFLYHKKGDWSNTIHYTLAGLRFVTVFLIAFLFLSPFFNYIKNHFEKPIIALVVDDSNSISLEQKEGFGDSLKTKLNTLQKALAEADFEVYTHSLDEKKAIDSLTFSKDETNLSEALRNTRDEYYNRNLSSIILVSDGLHNKGANPDNTTFKTDIYTIGIGDTTSKQDLALSELKVNKTTYINNSFPIKATVVCKGFRSAQTKLQLFRNDSLLQEKPVSLNKGDAKEFTFYTSEKKKGSAAYTVKVTPITGELTTKNNSKTAYIEVIDNKEKILLYAQSPHPDIKTFKSIIDKTDKYELDIYIEGIHKKAINYNTYHLVILHQSPTNNGVVNTSLQTILKSTIPKLFIVGASTSLSLFNANNQTLTIQSNANQVDEVGAYLNKNIELFTLETDYINEVLPQAPPLQVPFGDYTVKGNSTVLLSQKVGSIETSKPLFIVNQNGDYKEGVIVGEGLWRWGLYEFAEKGEYKLLNELITKSIQFLASKNDKRQLIVKGEKNVYFSSEPIGLNLETYNELYERIGNITTDITVIDQQKNKRTYQLISSNHKTSYNLNALPEGRYQFTANATIANKKHGAQGFFNVEKKQLESLDLQANHLSLQKIAQNNNGVFYDISNIRKIVDELKSKSYKQQIHSHEEYQTLRENWIYLLIIIGLLTAEWVIRKAKGSY